MLVEDALEAVKPMIESRHQVLTTRIPERLASVWVDVDMIRRVLINLLENASKFTPPEGKIELGVKQEGAEWVQLWIQDNGPGIPLSDQDRIFDKFTRLKGQETSGGLGVGLAFCRLAVQGHGGKIWVESKPDHGSRFILNLPVAKTK
jgi:signal transduction histidine kinase